MASAIRITKKQLLHTYKTNDMNSTTKYQDDEVINALGGVQNVLMMILSSEDIQLDNQQLIKIDQIINSKIHQFLDILIYNLNH